MIKIEIEQNPIKPIWAFSKPMKRVGKTNQHIRNDEVKRLIETSTGRTWDCFVCPGFTEADVDRKAVKDFLRRAGLDLSTPVGIVMRNLRLLAGAGYSNAAVLLFGRNPERFIVQAQLKCARFKGDDSVDFLDEQTYEGSVLSQYENAIAFVKRNTRRALKITGKASHDVVPEYPEEAVREALINALCHRNYAGAGTIQVRIYDNSLEIWNPGKLPSELTIKKLHRKHLSCPTNRLVANAFNRAGVIEQWGSGTLRIISACKEHGVSVRFKEDMGCFIVEMKQPAIKSGWGRMPEGSPKSSPKSSPKTEDRILAIIKSDNCITVNVIAGRLGISKRAVLKQIDKLKKRGRLSREGSSRAGKWSPL